MMADPGEGRIGRPSLWRPKKVKGGRELCCLREKKEKEGKIEEERETRQRI